EHERDARHRTRLGDVGRVKARMRMRGAQHNRVQASGRRVIGHIATGAAQQGVILLAGDWLAGAEFGSAHGMGPPAISQGYRLGKEVRRSHRTMRKAIKGSTL